MDRNVAPGAPGGATDVSVRVTKEMDAGIRVRVGRPNSAAPGLLALVHHQHQGTAEAQDAAAGLALIAHPLALA
jgi:hypothetical protein